jgi:hypothetical protein
MGLNKVVLCCLGIILAWAGCQSDKLTWQEKSENPDLVHQGMARITEIIKFDIFSPPVAARIYAYSSLAGYEGMRHGYPNYLSTAGILPGLEPLPVPDTNAVYCYPLCGISAMVFTGKALVFSEDKVTNLVDSFFVKFQEAGVPQDVYERSIAYGKSVSDHILAWSKSDQYARTRSLPKYTIRTDDPSRWVPTPPSYADALEPYWMEQRQWVLTSLTEVQVAAPVPFDTKEGSAFYKLAKEVYEIQKNITPTQEATAWYWDDNPYAVEANGHLMAARKKTSPGGHWMTIASTACKAADRDMISSMSVLLKTSVALMDGFIMTWQEKFRTNLIRPETYINKYIDPEFRPLIETPPFPEHPSGHATISAAAASVLSFEFGEIFPFTDSTEVEYGMSARTYGGFMEAAREAATSRLYGGIHYRTGNEAGTNLGAQIGAIVSSRMQLLKQAPVPPAEVDSLSVQ